MTDRMVQFLPLCGLDEYPIHQTVQPLRYVDTTDPRAFERYWFTAQDEQGEFYLIVGFGFYPNLGTADAYAIFVRDGQQTNIRAHCRLVDRGNIAIGPLRARPVAPFEEWHLVLEDNDYGFRFDLRWRDTKRANFRKMDIPIPVPNPSLLHNWCGYEAFGSIEGNVVCGGKTFQLRPNRVHGSRDHHWGTRDGVGGINILTKRPPFSHCGQWVEFKTWSIWGDQVLYNIGDERQGAGKAAEIDHKLRFDPVTKHFVGGTVRNRLQNGEVIELVYEQIDNIVAYLRGGMYSSPDGRGTPDKNHHHGMDVGDLIEGETYDTRDPQTRMRIAGFEDHLCRVTCGSETTVGIFECCNPVLYAMCEAGRPGYSFAAAK